MRSLSMTPFQKTNTNALNCFSVYILIKLFLSLLTFRICFPKDLGEVLPKVSYNVVPKVIPKVSYNADNSRNLIVSQYLGVFPSFRPQNKMLLQNCQLLLKRYTRKTNFVLHCFTKKTLKTCTLQTHKLEGR